MQEDFPNKVQKNAKDYESDKSKKKNIFTMVHYSQDYSYLSDPEFRGQHLELTISGFQPKISPFLISFYEDRIIHNQALTVSSETIVYGDIFKGKDKIVQVEGSDQDSLQQIIILLPKREKQRLFWIEVISGQRKLIGRLLKQTKNQPVSLFGKNSRKECQMSYTLIELTEKLYEEEEISQSLSKKQSLRESRLEESQEQNQIFQTTEEQPYQNEEYRQLDRIQTNKHHQNNDQPVKRIQVENNKIEIKDGSSENQFMPKKIQAKDFSFQGGPESEQSVQAEKEDEHEDEPIKQPSKPKHQFSPLLEQVLAQSKLVGKKSKVQTVPNQQQSQEQKLQQTEQQRGSKLYLYKQFQQKRDLDKSKIKQFQESRRANKYDHKTKQNQVENSDKEEAAAEDYREQQDAIKNNSWNYRTPLAVKPESKEVSPLDRFQPLPAGKLRGLTEKIYLKRFTRGSTNKKAEKQLNIIDQNQSLQDEIQPLNWKTDRMNLSRKPGFILSHRKQEAIYNKNEILKNKNIRQFSESIQDNKDRLLKQKQPSVLRRSIQKEHLKPISRNLRKSIDPYDYQTLQNKDLLSLKKATPEQRETPFKKHSSMHSKVQNNKELPHLHLNRNVLEIKLSKIHPDSQIHLEKVLEERYVPPIEKSREKKEDHSELAKIQPNKEKRLINQSQSQYHNKISQNADSAFSEASMSKSVSEKDVVFDIIIGNLSVNLYTKNFGRKYVKLALGQTSYSTDYLHGSHLLWVGRGYLFKSATPTQQMQVSLKCQKDNCLKILGTTKITVADLLVHYKQSFFQTYLFTPNSQLLAVIIIGFQILTHNSQKTTLKARPSLDKYPSKTQHQKSRKKQANELKTKRQPLLHQFVDQPISGSDSRVNNKKYQGGHNIILGKADRFATEPPCQYPGPGEYRLMSDFDRHMPIRDN